MTQILPTLALIGHPNSGKTSLFNLLTGGSQRVGNYPGITVESKKGVVFHHGQEFFSLVDLPGLYTLDAYTSDERLTRNILLKTGKKGQDKNIDLVLLVLDATNLEKGLYLYQELKHLPYPMLVVFNLCDLAKKRGLELDWVKIEEVLGQKSVRMVAATGEGQDQLLLEIEKILQQNKNCSLKDDLIDSAALIAQFQNNQFIHENFKNVQLLMQKIIKRPLRPDTLSQKIDAVCLHPIWGYVVLILLLIIMFQGLFLWMEPVKNLIEDGILILQQSISNFIPEGLFQSFLVDGVLAGVGNTLAFLPQILFLFTMVTFLEDVGYLGRAAYLMDFLMRRLGLPGKAVVPLISSHACAIPGIMAARTLENEKDRLVTMLVAPLITCSARIPVYTLLISALVPNITFFGPLRLPGLVMFALYMLGLGTSLLMARILKGTILTSTPSHLLMELPAYRWPSLLNILRQLWQKAAVFLKRAGTVILALSVVIWFLVSFPRNSSENSVGELKHSYAARIGQWMGPIFHPIGFDWRITTALIPSFGAREVVVSSLATVLSFEQNTKKNEKLDVEDEKFQKTFSSQLHHEYSLATLLSLLIWFVFSPQCISTLAILRKETNSWKWTFFVGGYTLALAYLASFVTYRVFSYL